MYEGLCAMLIPLWASACRQDIYTENTEQREAETSYQQAADKRALSARKACPKERGRVPKAYQHITKAQPTAGELQWKAEILCILRQDQKE